MKIKTPSVAILILFFGLNLVFSFSKDDIGLLHMHTTGSLSYSYLWALLNPFYWGNLWYNLYLLIPQTLVMLLEWKLVKMGRLSPTVFIFSQLTGIEWRLLNVPQEITVTLFSALATIFPPIALLEPLQKFPFPGQSSTHEVSEALPCYDWNCYGVAHFIRYWVLVAWFIFPIIYWLYKRFK